MPPSDAPVVGIAEVQEALQALAQHQRLEPLQNILRTQSDILQSHSEQLVTSVLALCTTKPPADTGFARLNVTWKVLLTLLTSPTLSEARYGEGLRYMFAQLRWAIVGHDWHEARLVKLGAFITSHVSSAIRGQAVRFTQLAATTLISNNNSKDTVTLGVQLMELYTLANVTVATTLRAHDAAKALYEAVVQRLDVVMHALGVACATGMSENTLKTNDRYRSYRLLIDVCTAQNVTTYTRREERVTCVLATLAAHLSLVQGFTQTLTKQLTEEEGGDNELRAVTAWTLRALLYWLPGMSLCAEADTPTGKGVHSETLRRIQVMAHDLPASLWLNSSTTTTHTNNNSSNAGEAPCERWQRCVSELLSIYCTLPLLPDTLNMECENDDGVMSCLVTALSSPHGRVGLRVLHACLTATQRTHELLTTTTSKSLNALSKTVTRRPCMGLYCMQQVLQLGQAMWKADMNTTTVVPVEQQQKAQLALNTCNTKENGTLNDERTCLSRWWTAWRAMSAAGLALLLGVVCVSITGYVPSMVLKHIQTHLSTSISLAHRDANQLPAESKERVSDNSSPNKSPEENLEEDGFVCLADFTAVLYLQTLPVEAAEQANTTNVLLANEQEEKVSKDNAELLRSLQALMEGMWSTYKPCTTTTNGTSHEEPTLPLQTSSQEQTSSLSSLHKTLGLMRRCVQILYQLQQLRRQCTTSMHSEAYTNAIHSLARPFAALTRALQAIASSSSSIDRTHTPTTTVSSNIVCERVVVRLFAAALLREAAHFTIRVESVAADAALLACVRRWVDVAFDICPASLAHVAVRRPRCDLAILSTGATTHDEGSTECKKKNANEEEEEEEENVNKARLQEALNEVVSYYATASLLYLVEHNTALPMDKLSLSELSVRLLMRLLQHINPDTHGEGEGEEENTDNVKKKEKAAAELRREDAKRFAHTERLWQACLTQYNNNSKSAAANSTTGSNTHTYTRAKDETMSVAALVQQWQQCAQSLRNVTTCLTGRDKKKTDEEENKSAKQVRQQVAVNTPSHTTHYSAEEMHVMREALEMLLTCAQQTQKSLTGTSCNGNTTSSCPAEPVIEVD